MRVFLFYILPLLFIFTSCSKDYTNPTNLSGTTWKSDKNSYNEYEVLKFTGKTTVELYFGDDNDKLELTSRGSYSLDEKNITIIWTYNLSETEFGVIDGKTLTIYDPWGDGVDIIYKLQ
jgi:hypothetical protein